MVCRGGLARGGYIGLTIITPTRNRPDAFRLLESYISRQTLQPDQWLVINDGKEPYAYNLNQTAIHRDPANDEPTTHSICHNYRTALDLVEHDKICCIEDDDYYHPNYLGILDEALDEADLVGINPAYYYHVGARRYRSLNNRKYATLASTGFRSCVVDPFRQATYLPGMVYLDCWLWKHFTGTKQLIPQSEKNPLQVGIKGLPTGERGIGIGHKGTGRWDRKGDKLREWIGENATNYLHTSDNNQRN